MRSDEETIVLIEKGLDMPKLNTLGQLKKTTREQIAALKREIKNLERDLKRMEAVK